MRIAYLSPSGRLGGAEVALLDILASIRKATPEWELILIVTEEGSVSARARALGVATKVLPFPVSLARIGDAGAGGPSGKGNSRLRVLSSVLWANADIRQYVERLRRALLEIDPQLIHSNGFKMHILGALAKPSHVPLVWHIHDYVSLRPLMARLIKRFRMRCSLALANSFSVKEDLERLCGRSLPVQTLHNGVDLEVFSPVGEQVDLDALSGFSPAREGTIKVAMLGTFARWKGHETFLRAFSLLPADPPVRGYIVGGALYQTEGSQYSMDELKTKARELGVSVRVGFTGFVEQPASALRAADIVVHASTQPEPFGLVIIEAMACGRAVIASEDGGARELFENGVDALGHTPGNAEQLAERILQLARDPNLRSRLGASARIAAEQRFNRNRLAAELIPIYQTAQQVSGLVTV
jgi:glycosyltransferase involved in cell wall biosynthesis